MSELQTIQFYVMAMDQKDWVIACLGGALVVLLWLLWGQVRINVRLSKVIAGNSEQITDICRCSMEQLALAQDSALTSITNVVRSMTDNEEELT